MHGQPIIKIKLSCYNSYKVRLCGGCIYNLYVDAAAVLARYERSPYSSLTPFSYILVS